MALLRTYFPIHLSSKERMKKKRNRLLLSRKIQSIILISLKSPMKNLLLRVHL